MHIITIQDERLLRWAEQRLDVCFKGTECSWIAGISDNAIAFVVVYSRFSRRNCEMTIATDGGKRWATRRSLRAIFHPPFVQWELERVTFMVEANNKASIRMCRTAGARVEGVLRKWFGEQNGVVFGMLRNECRYL